MASFSTALSALETKAFIAAGQAWATLNGFERFVELRDKQRVLRREYIAAVIDGSYEQGTAQSGTPTVLEVFAMEFNIADPRWFYYH